jgi:hypothetical protein
LKDEFVIQQESLKAFRRQKDGGQKNVCPALRGSIPSLACGTAWRGGRQGRHRQLHWHDVKRHFSVLAFVQTNLTLLVPTRTSRNQTGKSFWYPDSTSHPEQKLKA